MSKVFVNAYAKLIAEAVEDKSKLRKLVVYIENYFDKNNQIVFDQGPSKRLVFANRDKDPIYEFVGVDPKDVMDNLKKIPTIKTSWKLLNDPFVVLSVYIIRELEIAKKTRERDLVMMFLAMKTYSSRQATYFKYGANEQIMAYTLNNLSNKFRYKSLKNNYAAIQELVLVSHNTYIKLLLKGDDELLNTYYPQMYSRINKTLQKIAREYYENHKNKKYLNANKTFDDELGGELDHESSASVISGLAESTANYFMASSVNNSLARTIAGRNKVPYVTVIQTLMQIKKDESPMNILKLMSAILSSIYETDNALLARVCSQDFAITAIRQLSISNSKSISLNVVKSELDRLLDEYCSKYAATNRLATKMAYRNAIYSYFVYTMIANKCR